MTVLTLSRCGFVTCAAAAMLAGCGGGNAAESIAFPRDDGECARAFAFDVMYSFQGAPKDGETPSEALVGVNGTLYGTTSRGGKHATRQSSRSPRPVKKPYSIASKAARRTALRHQRLINVSGTLYGTTTYAGAHGKGVIFAITTAGTETVLYSFKGSSADGSSPSGALPT